MSDGGWSQDSGENCIDLFTDAAVFCHVPEETREVMKTRSGDSEIRTGHFLI
jgi:hypothetical protein